MDTRPLGPSGLRTSIIGLGANNFGRRIDLALTREVVDAALEEGITFVDTADIYGRGLGEEYLGEALRGRRDQVVLATKFGMDMAIGALLANETVSSVIAGATRPEQIRANAAAARWRPDAQDLTELRELLKAHRG